MGYNTDFYGEFTCTPPLSEEHVDFLDKFAETPHGGDPTMPGIWCQWIPTCTGASIEYDKNEKFYKYVEWIKYLIEHYIGPWGYKLNGEVEWFGDERDDMGKIVIVDNVVTVKVGKIVYEDAD